MTRAEDAPVGSIVVDRLLGLVGAVLGQTAVRGAVRLGRPGGTAWYAPYARLRPAGPEEVRRFRALERHHRTALRGLARNPGPGPARVRDRGY
ncbi:hypothetical protein JNUCC64_20440 [Streptomyces sp. JNUCC 64]